MMPSLTTIFWCICMASFVEIVHDQSNRAAGNLVFHGPREDVVPYFQSLGFYVPERKAVSDFLQEVTYKKDKNVQLREFYCFEKLFWKICSESHCVRLIVTACHCEERACQIACILQLCISSQHLFESVVFAWIYCTHTSSICFCCTCVSYQS